MFYSVSEIEKRKPEYASSEFWGGEKAVYDKGKKVGTEPTEGWRTEMLWKTLYRAAYGAITIDSQKIDDDFIRLSENEENAKEIKPNEVAENANRITVDFEEAQVVQDKLPEKTETADSPPAVETKNPEPPKQEPPVADGVIKF